MESQEYVNVTAAGDEWEQYAHDGQEQHLNNPDRKVILGSTFILKLAKLLDMEDRHIRRIQIDAAFDDVAEITVTFLADEKVKPETPPVDLVALARGIAACIKECGL
jgi:hypothetical protein